MFKLFPGLLVALFYLHGFTAQLPADSTAVKRAAFIKSQTTKSDSVNALALKLATPTAPSSDLNRAIELIMSGLHTYSKFRDSVGLRETFDNLGFVYHLQKKYTQAKWFILQSNTLSREKNDTLGIINSLITLASVKEDIKDYSLAKSDLNEALSLAKTRPGITQQIKVQSALADYYIKKGDPSRSVLAFNRIAFLKDSVVSWQKNQKIVAANNVTVAKKDSLKHNNVFVLDEDGAQEKAVFITSVTLITAILAGICVFLYLRSKKKYNNES